MSTQSPTDEAPITTFAEFLARCRPGKPIELPAPFTFDRAHLLREGNPTAWKLPCPRFRLHCRTCGGERAFDPDFLYAHNGIPFGPNNLGTRCFIPYGCCDCKSETKLFAVRIESNAQANAALVMKLGEEPPFGPPLPSRLVTLLRESSDLLSAARRCENQGMGIGAFVYYRRVLDNQRGKLFDEIIAAAKTLGGYDDLIKDLDAAKAEHRFTDSVGAIKHALPESLLVKGENPLTLLHGALSKGVHALSDAQCLERATAIRTVLTAFVERLELVIADESELASAVQKLRLTPST